MPLSFPRTPCSPITLVATIAPLTALLWALGSGPTHACARALPNHRRALQDITINGESVFGDDFGDYFGDDFGDDFGDGAGTLSPVDCHGTCCHPVSPGGWDNKPALGTQHSIPT